MNKVCFRHEELISDHVTKADCFTESKFLCKRTDPSEGKLFNRFIFIQLRRFVFSVNSFQANVFEV